MNSLIVGKTVNGDFVPVLVNNDGSLVISGGAGGGGDASAANQLTEINRLEVIRDRLPTPGQKPAANSQPVVLASDQPTVLVRQPMMAAEATAYRITAAGTGAGTSVAAGVRGGGIYCFSIAKPGLNAAALALASSTTTAGSTTVAYTGVAPAIGAELSGTGVPLGAFVFSVNPGVGFEMSLPASASGTVTINATGGSFRAVFEWSSDGGVTYPSTFIAIPRTVISQANVNASETRNIGLWRFVAPDTATHVRVRAVDLTNIPALEVYFATWSNGATIRFPYFSINGVGQTILPATTSVGWAVVPPIQTDFIQEYTVEVSAFAGTSQSLAALQSNDPTLAAPPASPWEVTTAAPTTYNASATAAGAYRNVPRSDYTLVRLTHNAALTSFTIIGVTARLGSATSSQSVTATIQGNSAQGATTGLGLPVLVGGLTSNAALTAADANGGLRSPIVDTNRRIVINSRGQVPEAFINVLATGLAATVNTPLLAAGGAGVRRAVGTAVLTNTTATAGIFFLVDGTTDIGQVSLPAGPHVPVPIRWDGSKRTSANAALQYRNSVAGMSVTVDLSVFNEA